MIHVTVVGAGGTGSYLIPPLSRMLNSPNFHSTIEIIDDDVVEMKNIERQNFISADLGYYKADVLVQRYKQVFQNVTFHSRNLRVTRDFYQTSFGDLVISCVDSVESRKNIVNLCINIGRPVILIDSGNEDQYGHVTISLFNIKNNLDEIYHVVSETLIGVLSNKVKGIQGSCATLGEQTLIQNNLQASVILKMMLNLTNIVTNCGEISPIAHPLDQLSVKNIHKIGNTFLSNKFLTSTYFTGSLSSKHDVVKMETIDILKIIGAENE